MSDLANYSIETDQVVLLSFKDGHSLRVPLKHLSRYLKPGDLAKVKQALNLRRHFLRIHMPRFFVVLAAVGGLVALLTIGGRTVASLLGHPRPANPVPTHTGIARSRLEATPQLSPNVNPAQSESRLAASKHTVKTKVHPGARTAVTVTKPAPAVSGVTAELTSQTVVGPAGAPQAGTVNTAAPVQDTNPIQQPPASTPTASPTPAPTASPSPSPAAHGQVLGDSTSPAN